MAPALSLRVEGGIARCRLVLSLVTVGALWLNHTRPPGSTWTTGDLVPFGFNTITVAVCGIHLVYSIALYMLAHEPAPRPRLAVVSTAADAVFAVAVGFATEGRGIPLFVFFTFAVGVLGLRTGFHRVVTVTAISMALYLGLGAAWYPDRLDRYVMQALCLGITGCLIAYLAQQRLRLEDEIREAARAEACTRVARELHDGCMQTLGAVDLKLASCTELLRRGRADDVLTEIGGLRACVNAEHDSLRAYMRLLGRLRLPAESKRDGAGDPAGSDETRFALSVDFTGAGALVDAVLQLVREGIRNVQQHARATSATVDIRSDGSELVVKIDDDGVGFSDEVELPWTIASRVDELGGRLRLRNDGSPGAHLEITLDSASALSPGDARKEEQHTQHAF